MLTASLVAAGRLAAPSHPAAVPVIVLERPGHHAEAIHAATAAGGTIGRSLALIGGFAASVPAGALAALGAAPSVEALAPDRPLHLFGSADDSAVTGAADAGSMAFVAHAIGADDAWHHGATGAGVDVALIDSGIGRVAGLDRAGKVVNGPDLSFDLQAGLAAHLDTFGHGTHLAGIIAGRDDGGEAGTAPARGSFAGIAPDARLINLKVAGSAGETDVSQVIAAIDWVVQHRDDAGLHIRVLNLAFGSDSAQDYRIDPLSRAVEVAWEHGIVVVVAAGNAGDAHAGLADPAYDPFVIAVGAADTHGTTGAADDTVPAWSGRGDGDRSPDLVAPGVSVRSLRVPGSSLDAAVPAPADAPRFIGGSGTSQAAAVVAGAAALLLGERPSLTPDAVKAILRASATPLALADATAGGAGLVDAEHALEARTPTANQAWTPSTGTGSLDAARGSARVSAAGLPLDGERDIFGAPFDAGAWAAAADQGAAWDGGSWNGNAWTGTCWCSQSWAGLSWSGLSWSGLSWSGLSWSGLSWSGLSWSGLSWSGLSWSGLSWSGTGDPALGDGSAGWTTVEWDPH
jgi:serine protease AprX